MVDILELDSMDEEILNLLQEDAKLPYAEIAEELGISSSGVHKRIKRLQEGGVIQRFVTIVDPKKIGKKLKAFIGVATESGRCSDVRPKLIDRPDILEVHEMAGEHDLFLKLITEDTEKLNEILHEIDRISGVGSTRTSVVLKTEKKTTSISF